jgi:hypothetical protein
MTQPTEAPASPPNRLPVILGAGLAVLLLVFLLTRLVGGGDEGIDESTTPTTAVRRVPSTTTTTVAGGQPVETFEVFTSKNPFLRLRGGGPAGVTGTATGGTTTGGTGTSTGGTSTGGTSTGGTSTGGTSTGGTTTGGSTGSTTTGGTTTGGTGSTSGTGGSTSPRRSDRVTLLDVFVERGRVVANVRVNDTVHKVGAGDTFATSYKVLSLSQGSECGRFAFGDDTFQLCRGEQALK